MDGPQLTFWQPRPARRNFSIAPGRLGLAVADQGASFGRETTGR